MKGRLAFSSIARRIFDGNVGLPVCAAQRPADAHIGLLRLDGEDLPVDLLGDLQMPRLMVGECHRQRFGNHCHGADCQLVELAVSGKGHW